MAALMVFGKRKVPSSEVMQLLAGYNLSASVMEGIIIDRALRSVQCSDDAILEYYRKQLALNPEFLNLKRQQLLESGVEKNSIDFFIARPVLIERFKNDRFGSDLESVFLSRKSGLDRVVFFMIRNCDQELIRELYFRIESGEESFATLAGKYSEGREAQSCGQLGPLELCKLNPALAQLLGSVNPGELIPPFVINGQAVVTMLHKKFPARLDESMRRRLLDELFRVWVAQEVQAYFY